MKIAISGASGFIGSHLLKFLQSQGHTVSPHPRNSPVIDGLDVFINLSGENIYGRWDKAKKERIRSSRVETTRRVVDEIMRLPNPPKHYLGASAVGYYGNRVGEVLTEESRPGNDFLSEICVAWEQIPEQLRERNIRVVICRFGVVLAHDGGALPGMVKPFKTGLGGKIGSGEQFFSWIALSDLLHAIEFLLEHKDLKGPFNFVAPHSTTNGELTKFLGEVLGKPALMAVPEFVLSLIFGEGKELMLNSVDARPKRLIEAGFTFRHHDLKKYLHEEIRDLEGSS